MGLHRLVKSTGALAILASAGLVAFACTSEGGNSPSGNTIPLWQTVVDATLIPTVTPSVTPAVPPTVTATSTPYPTSTPTTSPTATLAQPRLGDEARATSLPGPTATAVAERETYCRQHALPTSTPEPGETPTPVPTSPPGITNDQVPSEWSAKMDEIETWVRDFYEVEAESVGEFNRRFVADEVWKEWRADVIGDWAEDEGSLIHLWEQINRTMALLSANSDYTEFLSDYQGESYIGLYNPIKREIVVRSTTDEFNLESELVYVHEYAHHVQNAKYDLQAWRDCLKDDGDANGAYRALYEGDASNTEYAYIEEVIGWDRLTDFYESTEGQGGDAGAEGEASSEPVMKRYFDAVNDFTYSTGLVFVWLIGEYLHELAICANCETERQRIDAAFKKPPFTTEQVFDVFKYFDAEAVETIDLPDDLMGADWDLRHSSRIGKSDWVSLLAALTDMEADEFLDELPEWRGDYGMMFEDEENRALYLQVARWQGEDFIERLTAVFDGISRLKQFSAPKSLDDSVFEDYSVWESETGFVALAVEFEPISHVYTMFIGIGPDLATVHVAVHSARENLKVERGFERFPK